MWITRYQPIRNLILKYRTIPKCNYLLYFISINNFSNIISIYCKNRRSLHIERSRRKKVIYMDLTFQSNIQSLDKCISFIHGLGNLGLFLVFTRYSLWVFLSFNFIRNEIFGLALGSQKWFDESRITEIIKNNFWICMLYFRCTFFCRYVLSLPLW